MKDLINTLRELLSKITLDRSILFGLSSQEIVIYITPTLQIFKVVCDPKSLRKTFPFEEGKPLNLSLLKDYIDSNKWNISIHAKSPQLRRKMLDHFEDEVINESYQKTTDIEVTLRVIEQVEKSSIPESIKKWARNNPEKFLENLKDVEKIINS